MKKKDRNILANVAKLLAGTLLMTAILGAVLPAMSAYADETNGTTESTTVGDEDVNTDNTGSGNEGAQNGSEDDAEPRRPFPLPVTEGEDPSITVTMVLTGTEDEYITGDTMTAYKIAELVNVKEDGYKYEYVVPFKGLNTKYPLSTLGKNDPDVVLKDADAIAKDAAEIIDKAKDKPDPAGKEQVGKDGTATFDLTGESDKDKLGIYLIIQTMSEDNHDKYRPINPFIVTVPYYTKDKETGEYKANFKVDATPKTELIKRIEELTPCKADPPVQKIVTGTGAKAGDTFKFVFMGGTKENPVKDYPLPVGNSIKKNDYSVELSVTTKNIDGAIKSPDDDSAEFGEIEFKKAGTYIYTLYEDSTDKLENYDYDAASYKITYDVKIDDKNESLYVASITSEKSTDTKQVQIQYSNNKFARPAASQFTFENTYKPSSEKETTRPRKQSETTPRDRVTPTPSAPTESPTVAGATRTPEPEGGDVLGAARTPQAVLGASRLPQTGQLWWPVPVLMFVGIALMAGGLVKRRHDE